jgi:hypothetical protein
MRQKRDQFMRTHAIRAASVAIVASVFLLACGGSDPQDDINFGGDSGQNPPASDVPPGTGDGKVWSLSEVLSEPRGGGAGGAARCGGEFGFRRCVCPEDVPAAMRYRPALAECDNNAAILLDGQYLEAFSVVVRDSQNRDRWPASGFNGCSDELSNSESPPNRCSAFKVQRKFGTPDGTAVVHCLGASGYSVLFEDVVRATIKLSDDPTSNDDDIDRLCLISGDKPLN